MCVCVRACVRAQRALHRVASRISVVHVVRHPTRAGASLSVASVCTPRPDLCLSTASFGLGEGPLARHCRTMGVCRTMGETDMVLGNLLVEKTRCQEGLEGQCSRVWSGGVPDSGR